MKFLASPYTPYDLRSFLWTGPFDNHVWSASLANLSRSISFARVLSTGPSSDLEITIDPGLANHWDDFARVAAAAHPELTPEQAVVHALDALRQIHHADKRITLAARTKLVYRLKGDHPAAFQVADLPPTPAAIGYMRLAFGERLERVYAG